MDLKIKKINDKLDLDTEAQGLPGCDSDCQIYEQVYVVNVQTTDGPAMGIGLCGNVWRATDKYNSNVTDLL